MKKLVAGFVVALVGGATLLASQEMSMPGPQKEHEWLQQLVGEWTSEAECVMEPGKPPEKSRGIERVRSLGDLWILAEGQGEIALSTTVKAWDVAAIKILVEEAGGRLTDLDGRTGIYGSTVFASNGLLHDAALAAMRDGQ